MGNPKTLHHLAMTKPQKALLIFLTLVAASAVWALAKDRDEDEFENFEDGLVALSQVSEQITVNQLSLKSFRCQEKISIAETDSKSKLTQRQLHYSISRLNNCQRLSECR